MIVDQKKHVPTRLWYIAALMLVAVSAAVMIWGILFLINLFGGATDFLAPGRQTFTVERPGRYVIWHKHQTLYEGRTYSSGPSLPDGATIKVFAPDGSEVPMSQSVGATITSGSERSASVCAFDAASPGEYTIEIGELDEPHVMTVRRAMLKQAVSVVLLILMGGVGFLAALVVTVITAIRRSRALSH